MLTFIDSHPEGVLKLLKKNISPRKKPSQERAKETVEVIVTATAHILDKEGFEKVSTNKIAEKAGISVGSLYQYFPTKDAIFAFMMDRYVQSQTAMVDKLLAEGGPTRDLKTTIQVIITAIMETKRKQSKFNRMFAQKLLSFSNYEALNRQDDHLIALFRAHLSSYEKEIRTENLELTLYFVIQSVKCLPISLLFQNRFDFKDPKVDQELVELIYRYLKK